MKSIKKETPYGAKIREFESKVGRFKLKAHIFEETGEISYELNLGNTLQKFSNFKNIEAWKKSLSQDLERITAANEFIEEIESCLKEKKNTQEIE
jgi:hypothetical protein